MLAVIKNIGLNKKKADFALFQKWGNQSAD
jgi:hypothetical protein